MPNKGSDPVLCPARISNPAVIDSALIARALASGREEFVVQFSDRGAYDEALLAQLNRACEDFGAQLQVRFYAHAWKPFDCGVLRELRSVRSLSLDTLRDVTDLDALKDLQHLERFAFGAFEAHVPRLLETKTLQGVRRLTLVAARTSNIDLRPLSDFQNLQDLFLNKHSKNIGVLRGNDCIQTLALSQIARSVPLDFAQSMSALRVLKIILGGRTGIEEMANGGVEELEVLRVQGMERLHLASFPRLKRLVIEDQLRIDEIDLSPATELEHLKIMNCKGLRRLKGMKSLRKLRYLWIAHTKLDPDELLLTLPEGLQTVSLFGYGARRDSEIRQRLDDSGYKPVSQNRAQNETRLETEARS